ncbi:PAS domain-containing sensor histidine kinase [Burkholderia plantarii]|uniref:PAS domain-containing sensor histidine kinase n=1 Tax=Burkholderia plantarii TaxID=41899 RepID=UPI0018DB81A6|nr:PAS domain-containing sensor histidine kinase [Burkholderia plantarii]MBI0329746.1 PAS domain S-box protein [Burkholderia plantarii]
MIASGSSRFPSGQPRAPRSRLGAALARPAAAGFAAFAVGAVLSIGVAWFVGQAWQDSMTARFERRASLVTTNLRRELQASGAVLSGARGVLQLAPGLAPAAWRDYVATLDLEGARAPLAGLGYATAGTASPGASPAAGAGSASTAIVPDATRAGRVSLEQARPLLAPNDTQAVASAPAAASSGVTTSSTVTPPPASVTLFAPIMHGAQPTPPAADASALQRAVESGQLALAARPAQGGLPAALTLYLPANAADATPAPAPGTTAAPRRAPAGYLFAPLDVARLFELASADDRNLGLQAFAAPGTAPLYATDTPPADDSPLARANFRRTDTLAFGGATLTLAYTAVDATAGARTLASIVLAAGLIASLSLAAALAGWSRARAAARAAPSGSRLNEARMMGIIRSSMEAIITVDEEQKIVIFNPMAEKVFGVSAMDAIGAPLTRFIPPRFRHAHSSHIARFGVTGQSERHLGSQRLLYGLRANGDEFPIEASISQIHDGDGKLYTVMMRDVTERVQAENALKASREELRELSANLQRVREEEKTRIARELHDDLGQQLTALKMDLSAVEHRLLRDGTGDAHASVVEPLREMRRLIDATVASVRRIAADLRPVMLDDLGLVPAIEWLANDFTNRYGIDVERRIEPGDVRFPNATATALFRIVQEALTNVARHAEASRVELTLGIEDRQCLLRIVDDGVGADHADGRRAPDDKSFGLLGIRERAHMLGGTVRIETARDRGYALTITIPLPSTQDPNLP